jgi:ribose transport system substrate-binding protein
LCQWRGGRVTGAWLFIISLLKVLSIGDTAPRIESMRSELPVRVEPSEFGRRCNLRPAVAHPIEWADGPQYRSMVMKKLVVAAGIVAGFAFGVPAIAQTTPTIPVIVKDMTSPYWQAVLAGARKAGQDLGVNVVALGGQSESDVSGQISILEKAVASNPAAIVIAPAQFSALGKPIDEAAKKVKIIGIESAADTKAMTSLLATDDVNAGRLAADALAAAITTSYADTEGNIVMITSMPGIASLDQRAKGFKEVVAAKYRALDITADKVADGKPATVLNIVKDLIANTADLRGVFVSDPVMTLAVGQAVAGKKSDDKINVVGAGSDEKLVKLLQDDVLAGLVVDDPFRMGYDGVKTALAASRGEQVSANVDIGATLVTKANMNSARSQGLLNPMVK